MKWVVGLALGAVMAGPAAAFTCAAAPQPIVSLDYGSRYKADSENRSELDSKADAEANKALKPVDEFLRDLTETANEVYADGADKPAVADCVVLQMADWARAGALTELQSPTANLTIGARIAGFALVALQVLPETTRTDDAAAIRAWLADLMRLQTTFWEVDAPEKARHGNLRAWAALAAAATAESTGDAALRGWATWSINYVLCSADADGSLPQEMSRGKYALKYQLHAIAPLVVTSLLLHHNGIETEQACDHALSRVVGFAVTDLNSGAATQAITGKQQTFFDGTDRLEGFHLAWLEAYLAFDTSPDRSTLEQLAALYRPLNYSKLGGDQAAIWKAYK